MTAPASALTSNPPAITPTLISTTDPFHRVSPTVPSPIIPPSFSPSSPPTSTPDTSAPGGAPGASPAVVSA
jgi:hypothetical protein